MPNSANNYLRNRRCFLFTVAIVLSTLFALSVVPVSGRAQDEAKVQIFSGIIDPKGVVLYVLPDLKEGQTLYVYMRSTSGNLDPFVGLMSAEGDLTDR